MSIYHILLGKDSGNSHQFMEVLYKRLPQYLAAGIGFRYYILSPADIKQNKEQLRELEIEDLPCALNFSIRFRGQGIREIISHLDTRIAAQQRKRAAAAQQHRPTSMSDYILDRINNDGDEDDVTANHKEVLARKQAEMAQKRQKYGQDKDAPLLMRERQGQQDAGAPIDAGLPQQAANLPRNISTAAAMKKRGRPAGRKPPAPANAVEKFNDNQPTQTNLQALQDRWREDAMRIGPD